MIYGADLAFVIGVHDEDVVEEFKVIGLNFARAAENFVPAFFKVSAHVVVRLISLMEAEGARRVDEKLVFQASGGNFFDER